MDYLFKRHFSIAELLSDGTILNEEAQRLRIIVDNNTLDNFYRTSYEEVGEINYILGCCFRRLILDSLWVKTDRGTALQYVKELVDIQISSIDFYRIFVDYISTVEL